MIYLFIYNLEFTLYFFMIRCKRVKKYTHYLLAAHDKIHINFSYTALLFSHSTTFK